MIVDCVCCALTMSCYRARNHGETSGEVSILNRTWSLGRNYWFNCAPLRRQFICLHKIWRNVRNIFVGASTALGKARIFANRSAVLVVGAGADPGKLQGEGHESKWCPYLYPKLKTQRISAT